MILTRKGLLVFGSIFSLQLSAATIEIQNNNASGEGLNDSTDAASIPVQRGNNPGTTLGALRLNLIQEAADVWGNILHSDIMITVGAQFSPMMCDETGATLSSGSATSSRADFSGAQPGVAYNIALAESISRANLNGSSVEVNVTFNSDVDADDNCLGSGGFYYGLDGNVPPETVPLFPLVLHELAHGLGFSSFSDSGPGGTGEFVGAGGYPDSFSRNLLDLKSGKSWDEMDGEERKASALSEPSLVWRGARTTADLGLHLDPVPGLIINTPAAIGGEFRAVPGEEPLAIIPPDGVSSSVLDGNTYDDLDADPGLADGCSQIRFGGTFRDKIVLFDATDNCGAFVQARWSQVEGAVGVIIVATTEEGFPDMSGKYISQGASIPYIGVRKSVGEALRANLQTAEVVIGLLSTMFQGDNEGRLMMFAPATYREGASVSHWSKVAIPGLLMQPILQNLDYADVDLTAAAFRDIGWSVNIPGEPRIVIFKDSFDD